MSKMRWLKWYPGDFLNGVADLDNPNEIAAYAIILNLIYDREGPIEANMDRLAKRCMMRPTSMAKTVDALVEKGKLILDGGFLSNGRCEKLFKSREKVDQISEKVDQISEKVDQISEKVDEKSTKSQKKSTESSENVQTLFNDFNDPPCTEKHHRDRVRVRDRERERERERDRTEIESNKTSLFDSDPEMPVAKPSRKKPQTQIREDAQPEDADRQKAAEAGMTPATLDRQWRQFVDWHIAKAQTAADWRAAWRTWVGRWVDGGKRQVGQTVFGGRQPATVPECFKSEVRGMRA